MTNNHSGQGTGASVPDQALAVPAEPVARLGPTGFDPSRLFELADQCERASGPDREFDREIELAIFPDRLSPCPTVELLSYTASIGAAMTLVPGPDWEWAIEWKSGTLPYHLDVEMHARAKIGDPALHMEAEALR
jgi:hypothetical protein